MSTLFIDVGAYEGEASKVALAYNFDRVLCIEPQKDFASKLTATFQTDPRVSVFNLALWDMNITAASLYFSGGNGASLFRDKQTGEGVTTKCNVVDASVFLRDESTPADKIFLKLNCEGAECDILFSILGSDVDSRIVSAAVEFDCLKIRSKATEVIELFMALIDTNRTHVVYDNTGVGGSVSDKINKWLASYSLLQKVC